MTTKDEVARALAKAHAASEESVTKILRLVSTAEGDPSEPIKLLELNTQTVPTGIMPVFFGPSGTVPFPSVVVEVTDEEFAQVERQELKLPEGWQPGELLFQRRNGQ